MPRTAYAAPAALLGTLAACVAGSEQSASQAGARLFADNCAGCHGTDARGRGDAPDLTRLAAGAGGTFPTVDVLNQIHGGGGRMPAFDGLDAGDTVVVEIEEGVGTPVPADLLALWTYLEAVQRR
ncbi:cytochrome c [Jannaschia sp. Os4]|uniref:c-type cytochrome n=1 Tax=Jannaschia sp. Os4 TaxID=2807617 RepID=UPI0019396B31|nr:cytochrome c [Jannaschia sp. Os4]MBM2576461.1 cytochrome c [Jannaschia sp. Os4]